MSALRLVLARHGQTSANAAGILDTHLPGPGLTDLGRAQAGALGRALAEGEEGVVDGLYHSPALRAAETARIAAPELGLVPEEVEGTHEVQIGDLEGRDDADAVARFRAVYERWQDGDLDHAYPGGESGRDVLARYLGAVDRIATRHPGGGTVVLVSHGGVLRLAAQYLVGDVGVPPHGEGHVGNAGRVVLCRTPAGWGLEAWRSDVPGGLPATHDVTGG